LKSAVPENVSKEPVEDYLKLAKSRIASTRRDVFWTSAETLRAGVAASKSDADLAKAITSAETELDVAADPGKFAHSIELHSNYVTSIFLIGWATGGLFFGVLGDRVGRAKTMLITILLYSIFTGLSSFSTGFIDFSIYRFLTGLGVGGEFAVGVALVAEVMPERARPATLTLLQMLSAIGNITAAIISMSFGVLEERGMLDSPWRAMFLIGAIPALLALLIRWKLKEPERWTQLSAEGAVAKQLGSYRALFGVPRWRNNALIGLTLAFSGVVGLWAVGFFVPDLTNVVLKEKLTANVFEERLANPSGAATADLQMLQQNWNNKEAIPESLKSLRGEIQAAIDGKLTFWRGVSSICIQLGAFCGMFGFGYVAQTIGRKPTFAIAFILAGLSTAAVFLFLKDFNQLFWMLPIMGFFQLSLFAGYAIYFPELFPTYLRSTGTSFCYNVGRFIAATGPLAKGYLYGMFNDVGSTPIESTRYAGVAMCGVFLVGLLVLPLAPETKGKPLPE
jgi:MFS family permease